MNSQPTLIESIVTNILSSSAPHFATELQKKGISITAGEIAKLWNVPVECTIPKVITPSPIKSIKSTKSKWPKCIGVLGEGSKRSGEYCERTAKYGGYCKTHAKKENVDVSMEYLPSDDMINNPSITSNISSSNNIPSFIPSDGFKNFVLPLPDKNFSTTTVTTNPTSSITQNNPLSFIPPSSFIPLDKTLPNNTSIPMANMSNILNHNPNLTIEKLENQNNNFNNSLMDKVVTNSNITQLK